MPARLGWTWKPRAVRPGRPGVSDVAAGFAGDTGVDAGRYRHPVRCLRLNRSGFDGGSMRRLQLPVGAGVERSGRSHIRGMGGLRLRCGGAGSLNQSTRPAVPSSTSAEPCQGPRGLISSVPQGPIRDSMSALSGASPTVPIEASMPASSR
ncbi:hypothetical protein C1708_31700 [Streptomyces sp. DH-12]|nr:hypothetical protein C1708_31700 [Streptomyces sp. DH-12]